MDAQFRIPGTTFRFGLDSILGLIPGIGDFTGAAIAAVIVAEAIRLRVPWSVVGHMASNVLVDAIVGSIPVFGDIFDVAYKANRRNVRLLLHSLGRPVPPGFDR